MYLQSEPWCRISAQIYNCMEDYEQLGDAILTLVNEEKDWILKNEYSGQLDVPVDR